MTPPPRGPARTRRRPPTTRQPRPGLLAGGLALAGAAPDGTTATGPSVTTASGTGDAPGAGDRGEPVTGVAAQSRAAVFPGRITTWNLYAPGSAEPEDYAKEIAAYRPQVLGVQEGCRGAVQKTVEILKAKYSLNYNVAYGTALNDRINCGFWGGNAYGQAILSAARHRRLRTPWIACTHVSPKLGGLAGRPGAVRARRWSTPWRSTARYRLGLNPVLILMGQRARETAKGLKPCRRRMWGTTRIMASVARAVVMPPRSSIHAGCQPRSPSRPVTVFFAFWSSPER